MSARGAGRAGGTGAGRAGEMGRGVATLRKYKQGDLVCIYEGELVPHKEAVRRYNSCEKKNETENNVRLNV